MPETGPGVYIVALSEGTTSTAAARADCPVSLEAVERLLHIRPELRLDRHRPSTAALAAGLASCWLADEVILYIGLAGTSLAGRVGEYYSTPLGARSPHAGGWPLKTLAVLNELYVHHAACDDVEAAERAMLDAFIENVSDSTRAAACDPDLPLPFANLQLPRGPRKRHGITGARAPRKPLTAKREVARAVPPELPAPPTRDPAGTEAPTTQRVTAKDIDAGQIRLPAAAKPHLPAEHGQVDVWLRGTLLQARWDPRNGPDRPRSGVLRVGRGIVERRVRPDEVLTVSIGPDSEIRLD